jgi:hypothetical protein
VISLLLDRISESASRATRMGVFRRLRQHGVAAVPHVMERLQDRRWFVIRNMLALLNEIGMWPADFSPLDYARHDRPTVRREALQLAVRVPAQRERAIALALTDADERVVRIGGNAAHAGGLPDALVPTVLQRIEDTALSEELRATLIRLLAGRSDRLVVDRMTALSVQERRLRGPRLQPKTPELTAALAVLAAADTTDVAAQRALELARASADPEIRAAAAPPDPQTPAGASGAARRQERP